MNCSGQLKRLSNSDADPKLQSPFVAAKNRQDNKYNKIFSTRHGRDFDVDYNFLKIILANCAIQNDIGVIVEDLHVPIPARNLFTYLKPHNLPRNFLRVSCIFADSIALGEQISQISQTSHKYFPMSNIYPRWINIVCPLPKLSLD